MSGRRAFPSDLCRASRSTCAASPRRGKRAGRDLAAIALIAAAVVAGCRSKHDDGGDTGAPSSPSVAPTESTPGRPASPESTVRTHTFPKAPPTIGGYTLVDAFPSTEVICPSALVWPRPGAPPFLLERAGRIYELDGSKGRPLLDISSSVAFFSEGGALGMALHPKFGDGTGGSAYVFLWYNALASPNNRQRLSRFSWNAATRTFDASSELVMIEEEELHPEHNGGRIAFGPDGFLYFGNGDDTNGANHQRLDRAFFAGIFRIDVDSRGGAISHPPPRQPEGGASRGYFIPNGNPFVGVPGALEEFYALGLRNPFGFSFDRTTGALWVGDVGEVWREEIDVVVAGGNYGWPNLEGEIVRNPEPLRIGSPRTPLYRYSHAEMGDLTAVFGGYVYRGKALPELASKYVYSDWPSGRVWALDTTSSGAVRHTLYDNDRRLQPMAMAEDHDGELYVLHFDGITKLVRAPDTNPVPERLSDTTLFKDVAALVPSDTLVPYTIKSPLWSDGAAKKRWVAPPSGARIDVDERGSLKLPVGTMLVKHFELPDSVVPHGRSRRLETRVLVVGESATYGVSYRWNADGTDAELVREPADEDIVDDGGGQPRTWHFPSFGQCWSCHREENRVLGFTTRQLDLDGPVHDVFEPAALAARPDALAAPSDATRSLEDRASAYLAANCSGCHHHGASYLGGEDTWEAGPGFSAAERRLLGAPHHNHPMARALGLPTAPLIDPGNPDGSLLLARVKSNDPDLRMPPLGRNLVDEEGARLLTEWIRSLK